MSSDSTRSKHGYGSNTDGNRWTEPSASHSNSDTVFIKDVAEITAELFDLLIRKHKDYGPKNISMSPGGSINGLRVRMWDKLARISNLHETNLAAIHADVQPNFEPLEDSFKDLANYAIIGVMVLRGKWPQE